MCTFGGDIRQWEEELACLLKFEGCRIIIVLNKLFDSFLM